MAENRIEIKGSNFTLFVLHLQNEGPDEISTALDEKISQAPAFFTSAPIVINLEQCTEQPDFAALKSLIESAGLVPVGVTGVTEESWRTQARANGLAIMRAGQTPKAPPEPTPQAEVTPPPAPEPVIQIQDSPATLFHTGQVRSGQQLYAKNKNLVILGSVSAGAEVIADGSIHIYGTLRGRAIAGATGNAESRIICQNLQAELVSICGNYKLSETLQDECWQKAAAIQLTDEKLQLSQLD